MYATQINISPIKLRLYEQEVYCVTLTVNYETEQAIWGDLT